MIETVDRTNSCTWLLKPLQIVRLPDSFEITEQGLTMGRSEANEIVIPVSGFPYVSGSHARVRLTADGPVVEDLGSKNGTMINGTAVEHKELANGDILQLGNMGPRFAVVCTDNMQDTLPTVMAPAPKSDRPSAGDLTQSRVMRIKKALGIPRDTDVGTLIQHGGRRTVRIAWVSAAVAVLGAGVAFWLLSIQSRAEAGRLHALNRALEDKLADTAKTIAQQRSAWEEERLRLVKDSGTLAARLQKLETGAGASASELQELRDRLSDTHKQLELYDPINVELRALKEVSRVTKAVVFIETKQRLRHESGKLLYAIEDEDGIELNLKGKGEVFALESSGSGICVGAEGWIITNAHVVDPDLETSALRDRLRTSFKSEVELTVVFSGSSERRPAVKIKQVYVDDKVDLALLKIEPFDGMPHLPSLDVTLAVPDTGTEVFLCGFPLGKMAMQQGEVVIASTFKGILSRIVPPFLQVDAAVHPGNSGGPVMDKQGRILGIATRVQRTPDGPYAPTIGYVLPVKALAKIWPPPKNE